MGEVVDLTPRQELVPLSPDRFTTVGQCEFVDAEVIRQITDSPIEHQLLAAFCEVIVLSYGYPAIHHIGAKTIELGSLAEYRWQVSTQAEFPGPLFGINTNKRIDFLFQVSLGAVKGASLYVECDGINFHERTAKQAAADRKRDRMLQLYGCNVFRFLGAEITHAPMVCAAEIHSFLLSRLRSS